MKIKIRKSYYETNSSSVHAIIIPNKKSDLVQVNSDYYRYGIPKQIELVLDYYGWEDRALETINNRFNYIFVGLIVVNAYKELLQLLNLLDKLNIKLVEPYFHSCRIDNKTIGIILQFIEDFKISKDEKILKQVFEPLIEKGYIGIDHMTEFNSIKDYIFSNEEILIKVLFDDSVIATGNDNEGLISVILKLTETHPDYTTIIKGN